MNMRTARSLVLVAALAAGCASAPDDLTALAEQPPLDVAVLVTGGAFLDAADAATGTFRREDAADGTGEVIPIAAFRDVLERGRVFQRVDVDPDPEHRARTGQRMLAQVRDDELVAFLNRARTDGYDYVLVVEELRNGPIENQGTNSRWPVTFATWLLLGVGALIPDRTFESRVTLRVSMRELQSGRTLHERVVDAVPVDLALFERTDFWGLLASIVLPPFVVGDDETAVRRAVRDTTQRRLLLSTARELKSASLRQRLRDFAAADITLVTAASGTSVVVRATEGLSVVRLRGAAIDEPTAAAFAQQLLASVQRDGGRFLYTAPLPPLPNGGQVQVAVGTLRGGVASATFAPGATR